MVAYSFKPRFVEPILAGTKGGTIRAARRGRNLGHRVVSGGHAYPGEALQLYTGMRTKHCRLIARKLCLEVEPIILNFTTAQILLGDTDNTSLVIWQPQKLDQFARFDGFIDFGEMRDFWRREHFTGWHIRWRSLFSLPAPYIVPIIHRPRRKRHA